MNLWIKIGIVFTIICLLLIPLYMVGGLADERKSYKNETVREIAANFGQSQTIMTPYLRIDYEKAYETISKEGSVQEGNFKEIVTTHYEPYQYYLPPQTIDVQGDMNVETKYRRIYSTAAYVANFQISGYFQLTEAQLEMLSAADTRADKAFLEFCVTDSKGLRGDIEIIVNGENLAFEHDRDSGRSIIRVAVPVSALTAGEKLDFQLQLPINGTSAVSFVPTALANNFNIKGNWPHPKFNGNYLPDLRTVSDTGFDGQWSTSWLSGSIIDKNGSNSIYYDFGQYSFGVEFIDPVDIYSLVDRAVKYGYLVIVLTFLIIFMMEALSNVQVHPVQYGLTGVALTIFYLLLLSLSEHISFALSYLLASIACIGLISFYMHFSLKKAKYSIIFAVCLVAWYLTLFMLLNVNDYALLLGSVLIFIVLAALMIATRHINWFAIGMRKKEGE